MLQRHNFVFALCLGAASLANAQVAVTGQAARPLITRKIDESKVVTLAGNTRPEATTANDRGAVADSLPLEHIQLQLQRSAEQTQAVEQAIAELQNPKSANFHKWLTAEQFGAGFGASQADITTVTAWLTSHGFTVNQVYPSGLLVDFSGTAGQVRQTFQTEMHYLEVSGVRHVANMSDPKIPAALASAVGGIVSLHDFSPHSMKRARPQETFTYGGQTYEALTPEDVATIYNLNPLFAAGVTGQGQTIAVIEDTNLYSSDDWTTFRNTFGLSQYSTGSLTTVYPAPTSGFSNCANPGIVGGDDEEAALDAEWASAAAPGAAIEVAACADTRTTFGGLIALQNLVNSSNPPSVVSISYGECEAENGVTANAAFNLVYQQAAAEGISVFVAAGDEGGASCDSGATSATHGIGVSGWASTAYNVAVGGTDFSDSYTNTVSNYWNTTNDANYGSALSYIPEIPWDDSCASGLLSGYLGYASPYGSGGFCASRMAQGDGLVQVAAGSGGPSGCATGNPDTEGVVSGTCQGWSKPSWQSGAAGNPGDNVRDIPDVSLFAGTGVWGHYYVICFTDVRNGGASCTGDPSNWAGGGGTSFATPILAGVQALVNQNAGSAQGNPNYVYYNLAANSASVCTSSNGDPGSGPCIFHNITQGDISVDCGGSVSCYGAVTVSSGGGRGHRGGFGGTSSSSDGALSISTSAFSPAFAAASGWNMATGLGSINANNLVMNWASGQ
ncbi:MAG: protease pro-enzyme activation domain-containing protein [Bryobacteraceae bacterium]